MDTRDEDNMENSEKVDIEYHINQFQMLKTVGTGDDDKIIPAIAMRQRNVALQISILIIFEKNWAFLEIFLQIWTIWII